MKLKDNHPVLGFIATNRVSELFGSGNNEFYSPFGIDGLAQEFDTCLELLALIAKHPGRGDFRKFISAAKEYYTEIRI